MSYACLERGDTFLYQTHCTTQYQINNHKDGKCMVDDAQIGKYIDDTNDTDDKDTSKQERQSNESTHCVDHSCRYCVNNEWLRSNLDFS